MPWGYGVDSPKYKYVSFSKRAVQIFGRKEPFKYLGHTSPKYLNGSFRKRNVQEKPPRLRSSKMPRI